MRKSQAIILSCILPFALGACSTSRQTTSDALPPEKPHGPVSFEEHCAAGMRVLGNAWVEPFQKAAAYEMMRNDGCMAKSRQ